MRNFGHWSPRYFWNRLNEKAYRRSHPQEPWLTPTADLMLETYLLKTDVGLEFGSGRSTLWFARHVAHLTSVEHNPVWFERISRQIKDAGLANVNYCLKPRQPDDGQEGLTSDYVKVSGDFADDSLDFVLVDGICRSACAMRALPKIRPGGLLVIDNANLYLPCKSHSPNSRTAQKGPSSDLWKEFLEIVKGWRMIWTSNGVADTAFYFRPWKRDPSGP
ncbi:MAG TPA: class I SAM-dependent methyltransferase [Anaerolineaceae bacterium]|nr:class I SAM-dependent methyltransferase [Anaerolineaceae bacterium]